jgi:hypothetical protein
MDFDPSLWKQLPYEIGGIILEQLCLVRLHDLFKKNSYEEIPYLLRRYGCIISGSIIIQCLLGEEYDGTDIDIYMRYVCRMTRALRSIHAKESYINEMKNIPHVKMIEDTEYENYPNHWKIHIDGYFAGIVDDKHKEIIYNRCGINRNIVLNKDIGIMSIHTADSLYTLQDAIQFIEERLYELFIATHDKAASYSFTGYDRLCRDDIAYARVLKPENKLKINTICLKTNNLQEWVEQQFDSETCTISYDGANLSKNFHHLYGRIFRRYMTFRIDEKWKKLGDRAYVKNTSNYAIEGKVASIQ